MEVVEKGCVQSVLGIVVPAHAIWICIVTMTPVAHNNDLIIGAT